ncbi:MAG: hypothetical protein A2636_03575 [Elusimicrobia bacterium RIFCSPHIGHO2_01_FULL_64_10]|nr:MAG: hypothetical protein A2636_03575 [Elusimicrobia bacterium RIFCSPHIGHO2_01_FULL_64_10]
MIQALGIYREVLHSPDRETDDSRILELTGRALALRGCSVTLKRAEEIGGASDLAGLRPDLVFMMCEQEGILHLVEEKFGSRAQVFNSVESVRNTYRFRMIPRLQQAGVPMPESRLVSVSGPVPESVFPVWVKRGDVHNTRKGDVFPARTSPEIDEAFASFRSRGITHALLQEHVPGDLIKFYGIGDAGPALEDGSFRPWFKWFYHKNQDLKRHPFSEEDLREATRSAARALGLEVYGGDAIAAAGGRLVLIDLNAWPSFALFRDEAARAIAETLLYRTRERVKA